MSILLFVALGCGQSPPAAKAPVEETPALPSHEDPGMNDPKEGACKAVFTADDANALYQAFGSMKGLEPCKFEGVHVTGSTVKLTWENAAKEPASVTAEPTSCVESPPEGALVAEPYVFVGISEARKLCPEAMDVLIAAAKAGKIPTPSVAE